MQGKFIKAPQGAGRTRITYTPSTGVKSDVTTLVYKGQEVKLNLAFAARDHDKSNGLFLRFFDKYWFLNDFHTVMNRVYFFNGSYEAHYKNLYILRKQEVKNFLLRTHGQYEFKLYDVISRLKPYHKITQDVNYFLNSFNHLMNYSTTSTTPSAFRQDFIREVIGVATLPSLWYLCHFNNIDTYISRQFKNEVKLLFNDDYQFNLFNKVETYKKITGKKKLPPGDLAIEAMPDEVCYQFLYNIKNKNSLIPPIEVA